MGDTWRIKILSYTRVISSIKECLFVTDAIMRSSGPGEQIVISFDCEGINLGAKGHLTLIEIGTTRGEAFIFDLLSCPEMVLDGGLKTLLESENVIKVIHDCRNDSINLYTQYDILLRNVFDTQVCFKIHRNFQFVKVSFVLVCPRCSPIPRSRQTSLQSEECIFEHFMRKLSSALQSYEGSAKECLQTGSKVLGEKTID